MIIRKLRVGYADIDEFSNFEDVSVWTFLIAEEVDRHYHSFIKEIPESDCSLVDTVSEGDDASASIAGYLFKIDAVGRSKEIYFGTIRCAIEDDLDGLSDLIGSTSATIDLLSKIPDEIQPDHDGRLFVICETLLVQQEFDIKLFNEEFIACGKCLGLTFVISV